MQFFTIGYGGRSPAEFTSMLTSAGVRTVVDVRLRPDRSSMGAYGKSKTSDKGIEHLLSERGMGYVSLIELGNIFMEYPDWRPPYRVLLDQTGDLLTARLDAVEGPWALLCAEKRVAECHRGMIAEFLQQRRGWTPVHLE